MRFLADGPMTMIDNKDKVLEISKMMGIRTKKEAVITASFIM